MKHIKIPFFYSLAVLISLAPAFGSSGSKKEFRITEYGAVGDGKTVNTPAIRKAIEACAKQGGGTVIVPEGIFISGALFMEQGVNLRVEKNGILKGTTAVEDYPIIDTRWEGTEREWTSAFINAFNMQDFTLDGEGMIDGSGDEWMILDTVRLNLKRDVAKADQGAPKLTKERPGYGRPRLIAVQNCTNVKISGLKMKNQACWGVFILYSENVLIENLTITAQHNITMSDGIDIDSSKKVRITGCTIDVNDDCIAIKSGKDEDGLRVNRPSEDILVENCDFRYGHGGVSMGSEMSGGIRNVEIRNCVVQADNWAPIRFKSQPSRGGVVENITYRDITLKNTRKAFEFNMEWRMVNPKPPSDPLPVVRNVKIINVSGTTGVVGDMHGLKDSPIVNVSFENCNISAKRGFRIDNVEQLDTSGLKITVEEGPAIIYK